MDNQASRGGGGIPFRVVEQEGEASKLARQTETRGKEGDEMSGVSVGPRLYGTRQEQRGEESSRERESGEGPMEAR